MDAAKMIQIAVARADLFICAVWPYTLAALLAAGIALALWWGISRWKARRYR